MELLYDHIKDFKSKVHSANEEKEEFISAIITTDYYMVFGMIMGFLYCGAIDKYKYNQLMDDITKTYYDYANSIID